MRCRSPVRGDDPPVRALDDLQVQVTPYMVLASSLKPALSVFEGLCGNLWDLVQPVIEREKAPPRDRT
jgi:hypothetical protein